MGRSPLLEGSRQNADNLRYQLARQLWHPRVREFDPEGMVGSGLALVLELSRPRQRQGT